MDLVVLDLEATCEPDRVPDPQEIIQIGAAIVSPGPRGLYVRARFAVHVRPSVYPVLSSFCRDLTGITQADVDRAPSLPVAMQHLGEFIMRTTGGAFRFVTHGRWDLEQALPNDPAFRPGGIFVRFPYVDIKRWYTRVTGEPRERTSVAAMCAWLGVAGPVRDHDAGDDAAAVARCVCALDSLGARMSWQDHVQADLHVRRANRWACLSGPGSPPKLGLVGVHV